MTEFLYQLFQRRDAQRVEFDLKISKSINKNDDNNSNNEWEWGDIQFLSGQ